MAKIELRVFANVHLYYEFIDDNGQRIAQVNGLSTDKNSGISISIGLPNDSSDVTMMYTDKILESPIFGDTSDINERTGALVIEGTELEIRNALSYLEQLSEYINAQQLPYIPGTLFDIPDVYNSNSVANTVWNVLGQILPLPNSNLGSYVEESFYSLVSEDVLQGNTWSPNFDGNDNIIGSVVENTGSRQGLIGASGDDRLFGLDGNDVLVGRAGNDYLDGGFDNDTAMYTNSVEKPAGADKTLKLDPPNDGITAIIDDFSAEGIDLKVIDRYGDTDSLVNIERIVAESGQTNILDIRVDNLREVEPFTFEINGKNIQFQNFNEVRGDDGNQTFNLLAPSGGNRIIDGGGGTNTLTYSFARYDVATGVYSDLSGTYKDTINHVENISMLGGTIVLDMTQDYLFTPQYQYSYAKATQGLDITITNSGHFTASGSGTSATANFSQSVYVEVDTGAATHSGTVDGFKSPIYMCAANQAGGSTARQGLLAA